MLVGGEGVGADAFHGGRNEAVLVPGEGGHAHIGALAGLDEANGGIGEIHLGLQVACGNDLQQGFGLALGLHHAASADADVKHLASYRRGDFDVGDQHVGCLDLLGEIGNAAQVGLNGFAQLGVIARHGGTG